MTTIRWGILGAAEIARKNWKAIRNSGNGIVAAVASRDAGRGQRFIADCQREAFFETTPVLFTSYEALLASPEVDAVYIPLPTGVRKQWVIRAAEAGKHVICEKPCAVSVADLRDMIDACARRRVQFMDGVMFMHSRRLIAVHHALEDRMGVGQIKRIAAGFSFCAPPEFFTDNIRSHGNLEPAGCLGDLGWYCIRFALWTMKEHLPTSVTGRILSTLDQPNGELSVPTEFSAELFFEGGVSASFYCSFLTELQQWVHVSGTKGSLRLNDFVLPYFGDALTFEVSQPKFRVSGCDFNMEPNLRNVSVSEYSNSHRSSQETNLFRSFAAQIHSGRLNVDWPDVALKTQQVMEACLVSARENGRMVQVA